MAHACAPRLGDDGIVGVHGRLEGGQPVLVLVDGAAEQPLQGATDEHRAHAR